MTILEEECIVDLHLSMTQRKGNIFLELKQEAVPEVIGNVNLSKYSFIIDRTCQNAYNL